MSYEKDSVERIANHCQRILGLLKKEKFNKSEMRLLLGFFESLVETTKKVIARGGDENER